MRIEKLKNGLFALTTQSSCDRYEVVTWGDRLLIDHEVQKVFLFYKNRIIVEITPESGFFKSIVKSIEKVGMEDVQHHRKGE